jgi:glycosyltransferase involved in cell wall biosynthesis
MKIALIHDYITSYGGAEKTFKVLTELFPQAEVYTLFYDPQIKKRFFFKTKIKTSFLQKFPAILKKKYQLLLPFLPVAAETLDFREFDVVISSSFSFAKGIITRPQTKHISYCYSPNRYLWLNKNQKTILWKNPVSKLLFHYVRIWDRQASERVDQFIAISKTVQQRIKKYYKRESTVIYPPVKIPRLRQGFGRQAKSKKEFYLIVSQLRKYKRIDLAVDAFNKLGLKLVIIGEGPEKERLERKAKKNIKFLGWQPDRMVNKYYKNCTAFIFPGEDDFGIAPVEAMAHAKPVLAYRKGGAIETVIEGKTGEFFDWQHSAVLADGIRRLRQNLPKYNPKFISTHAHKFSRERFEKEFGKIINKVATNI